MQHTILFASGKGGVGKSTAACGIGKALAAAGKKTLIVDCDAALNSVKVLLQCSESCVFNWLDVWQGRVEAAAAITEAAENLWVLSAPVSPPPAGAGHAVAEALKAFGEDAFDLILLDAPAGIDAGLKRAAEPADSALVVATADTISVHAALQTDRTLAAAGIKHTRLLINRYSVRAARKGQYLSLTRMIDSSEMPLIGVIPEDKALTYASVVEPDGKRSKSAEAFERIAKRIQGEHVPLTRALLR